MAIMNPISSLFGRSPFGPLQKHMKLVEECTALIVPLFEALCAGERERILQLKKDIFRLEEQADDVKNEIRSHLPRSLFMPVDRRDLLDMLNAQDSIADTVQDIAGLLVVRDMKVPAGMADDLLAYVQRNLDATRQCGKVIGEIDELVETSFRGRAADLVEEMISKLGAIETETDQQGMALTETLFAQEDSMKPLAVIFWYQMLERLGDVADYAEDVGDRLRLLIAR